jgi:hypothetical protein
MSFERYPWGEQPPQAGETIVGCGHTPHHLITAEPISPRNPWQWFELSKPITSASPMGNITSRWIACCASCLRAAGGDARRVAFSEHWKISERPPDHDAELMRLQDPEAIRAYLERLSPAELVELAAKNL